MITLTGKSRLWLGSAIPSALGMVRILAVVYCCALWSAVDSGGAFAQSSDGNARLAGRYDVFSTYDPTNRLSSLIITANGDHFTVRTDYDPTLVGRGDIHGQSGQIVWEQAGGKTDGSRTDFTVNDDGSWQARSIRPGSDDFYFIARPSATVAQLPSANEPIQFDCSNATDTATIVAEPSLKKVTEVNGGQTLVYIDGNTSQAILGTVQDYVNITDSYVKFGDKNATLGTHVLDITLDRHTMVLIAFWGDVKIGPYSCKQTN